MELRNPGDAKKVSDSQRDELSPATRNGPVDSNRMDERPVYS